jgi:phospholipid transport system substrate-binding protein
MRRILIALTLASAPALVSLAPVAAYAAPSAGAGTTAVKSANEKIAELLKQKTTAGSKEEKELAGKVTTSVRDFLDIDELGKRAMGTNWAKLSDAQQKEFLTLLRALIEDSYIKGLRANVQYAVEYKGETQDKDKNTVVLTTIKAERKGRPLTIKVDYVLVETKGKLRAFDVRTDGVSLVDNYKSMFDKIMTKDGADGLIAKMKKKQAAGASATP